jgi:hypothetical protein
MFFIWYPLLAFLNLPWNALVVLQADRKYLQILVLKSINSGLFFFDNFSTFFNLSFEFKSAYHCSCTDKCYDIDYEYDITMGRYFTINKN